MIPQTVQLVNATGIRCGLGRNSIIIGLHEIPDDATVIAIKADNGGGKSTLLNLGLTPWRNPPMLKGSIYDYFDEGEGARRLSFSHGGEDYTSEIMIEKTAKTKKMRAFLAKGGDPYSMADGTVSDGKGSTYDKCLEDLLGPQNLYFLSAFRAQNSDKLADVSDPKSLMKALLDLSYPEELLENCKHVLRGKTVMYSGVQNAPVEKEEKVVTMQAAETRANESRAGLVNAKDNLIAAEEELSKADIALRSAMELDAEHEKIRTKRDALHEEVVETSSAFEHHSEFLRTQIAREIRSQEELRVTMSARRSKEESAIMSYRGHIRSAQVLIHQKARLIASITNLPILEKEVESLEAAVEKARALAMELSQKQGVLSSRTTEKSNLSRIGNLAKDRLAETRTRALFVSVVPCHGEPPYDGCPALAEAVAAEGDIANQEAVLAKLRDEYGTLAKDLDSARLAISEMEGIIDPEIETKLKVKKDELQACRDDHAKLEQLATAEKTITEFEAAIEKAENDLEIEMKVLQERVKESEAERNKLDALFESGTQSYAANINKIRAQIAELDKNDPAEKLEAARKTKVEAQRVADMHKETVAGLTAGIAESEAKISILKAEIADLEGNVKWEKELGEDLEHWKRLKLGLQGVIDLTIEDAGPAVSAIANKLLLDAYGPRFTVKIQTQKERANGTIAEDFSVIVIDAQSDVQATAGYKSGGESVWIDKALTDAVAIFHQQSSGVDYECVFADETEDGLTQERKAQFYNMDRAALAAGGWKRKYHISHDPQAWQLADHVIDLGEYRADG